MLFIMEKNDSNHDSIYIGEQTMPLNYNNLSSWRHFLGINLVFKLY